MTHTYTKKLSMDPKTMHYVYSYGSAVLLIIVYLLWRPAKNKPSSLKLRESGKALESRNPGGPRPTPDGAHHGERSAPLPGEDFKNAPENTGRIERQLNVIFHYNGHDFDAYEVFGVPAGSNPQVVQIAYEEILMKSDKESRNFYEVAYRAILQKSARK